MTAPDDIVEPRKRPKPGERRLQILQSLAAMLEQPGSDRITTAALAARLEVSEAALYRHFASKAQMFEALIDYIESSTFTLVNQVQERAVAQGLGGAQQVQLIATLTVEFAEKNPGMCRVMVGDALVLEHARLQERMNLYFDKLESSFKQCLRDNDSAAPTVAANTCASAVTALLMGRLQRYVRSGFKRPASLQLKESLALMLSI
jgi:TetR/AcrR family transcriptional regulator